VIDDFGTGYSSLSRLTQFPISRLKIDRSFVASLDLARQAKIARLIVNLSKVLGFDVTAEGVERAEQRDSLLAMGCRRAQGWLFAQAMPVEQATQLADTLDPVAAPA
jgi:EAL domain-containing protein (putative c-di-GMP-specific phosphodiesterase class I)